MDAFSTEGNGGNPEYAEKFSFLFGIHENTTQKYEENFEKDMTSIYSF